MENSQPAHATEHRSMVRRVFSHPIASILFEATIFLGTLILLKTILIKPMLGLLGLDDSMFRALQGILTIAAEFFIFVTLIRIYEKRKVTELSLTHLGRDSLVGTLMGAGMVSAVLFILWLSGAWYIVSTGTISGMIVPVIWIFLLATWEELVFRGIIYRIIEKWLGTIAALILSASIFGGLHIFNDNADLLAVLSAATGGLLMGTLYSLTGRLWIPIFFHAAWNLTQAIFGSVVSGSEIYGTYFKSVREGPDWLTGGTFGIESSLVTFGLMLMLLTTLLLWMKQRNLFFPSGGGVKNGRDENP